MEMIFPFFINLDMFKKMQEMGKWKIKPKSVDRKISNDRH